MTAVGQKCTPIRQECGVDMRGKFQTDVEENYYFRTVPPFGYMIPLNGLVGGRVLSQKRMAAAPRIFTF